jgi:hypothetical protein
MKGGMQAALALGVGYVLGRRRKMRLITVVAAATATGGLGGLALKRGVKMAGSSEALGKFAPQLGELAGTMRNELMDAGKAAATAAVTNRIESLTDSLQERAEMVRDPAAAVTGAGKAARSAAGGVTRRTRRGQDVDDEEAAEPTGEEEPYPDDPEAYDEEADEPQAAPVRRRSTARRRPDGQGAAPGRRQTTRRWSPVPPAGR